MSATWDEVDPIWQRAFELAWEAYVEGSNPIAAVITNAQGQIVATGKSAVRGDLSGVRLSRCEIAHAEVNALAALDNRQHTKQLAADYTLWATLEPCPLCMAALYMSDVKSLRYAARDGYAGSTDLLGSTPYLSRKKRSLTGPEPDLEQVSVFLNVYWDLRRGGVDRPDVVHEAFAGIYPRAVAQAQALAPIDALAIEGERSFGPVFEKIVNAIEVA